jgi:ATP-dependent Clp protease ATP-binding subunit ClpA
VKQEAFEEATKLTNQFRSLDEDEIDFLDSVQEAARAKELAEKRATKEGLEEFRKQQEEAERAAKEQEGAVSPPTVTESWSVGPRKRKKGNQKDGIGGLKIRRTSTGEQAKKLEDTFKPVATKSDDQTASSKAQEQQSSIKEQSGEKPASTPSVSPPAPTAGLGLGAYSSDED